MEDIERYVNGEMEGDELKAFESKLQNDAQLQAEVNRVALLITNLKMVGLSNKIRKAQKNNQSLKGLKLILVLGIVFVLLALLFVLYFPTNNQISPAVQQDLKVISDSIQNQEEIRQDSIQPKVIDSINNKNKPEKSEQPIAFNSKSKNSLDFKDIAMEFYFEPRDIAYSRGEDLITQMDSAKFAFNNEEFSNALAILNRLPQDNEVDYFKGHVYFRLGQFSKSNEWYKKAYSNENKIEKKEQVEWYQLLNYLACGDPCKLQFEELLLRIINNTRHKHYMEAIKLKKRLS